MVKPRPKRRSVRIDHDRLQSKLNRSHGSQEGPMSMNDLVKPSQSHRGLRNYELEFHDRDHKPVRVRPVPTPVQPTKVESTIAHIKEAGGSLLSGLYDRVSSQFPIFPRKQVPQMSQDLSLSHSMLRVPPAPPSVAPGPFGVKKHLTKEKGFEAHPHSLPCTIPRGSVHFKQTPADYPSPLNPGQRRRVRGPTAKFTPPRSQYKPAVQNPCSPITLPKRRLVKSRGHGSSRGRSTRQPLTPPAQNSQVVHLENEIERLKQQMASLVQNKVETGGGATAEDTHLYRQLQQPTVKKAPPRAPPPPPPMPEAPLPPLPSALIPPPKPSLSSSRIGTAPPPPQSNFGSLLQGRANTLKKTGVRSPGGTLQFKKRVQRPHFLTKIKDKFKHAYQYSDTESEADNDSFDDTPTPKKYYVPPPRSRPTTPKTAPTRHTAAQSQTNLMSSRFLKNIRSNLKPVQP